AQLEAKPGAQVDGHRLALAERLALRRASECHLEAYRSPPPVVLGLELEEENQVVLDLTRLTLEHTLGGGRHQRAMGGQRLLAELTQPCPVPGWIRRFFLVANLTHDRGVQLMEDRAACHWIDPQVGIRLGVFRRREPEPALEEVAE